MSDEQPKTHPRLRPAQVFATTLAAVSGAFLASRFGLYGTVLGAAVLSLTSTVGAELYLRSLDRTKAAAKVATDAARSATLRQRKMAGAASSDNGGTVYSREMDAGDTRVLVSEEVGENAGERGDGVASALVDESDDQAKKAPRKGLRWSLIAVGTVVAFGLAMLFVTGFEAISGKSLDGGEGHTISNVVTGKGSSSNDEVDDAPGGREPGPGAPTESPEPESSTPNEKPTTYPEPDKDDEGKEPPVEEDPTTPPDEGEETTPPDETPPPEDGDAETPEPTPAP